MSQTDDQYTDTPGQPAGSAAAESLSTPEGQPEGASGFPIVGIGASAGGLEALETFFTHMSPASGMAFVVILHLDPTHKSILLELLQRHTQMKVFKVKSGMAVNPDCVYVIPPNRDLTLKQGRLYLAEPKAAHSLTIDIFLRSLAHDQADRAIGVILSGAGSDGTLGLKAIKEAGGLMLVQDPDSARYGGMPESAIATGLVDFVLQPEEMPERLEKYIKLAPFTTEAHPIILLPESPDVLRQLFAILRIQVGHDFSLYKKNTVKRRIERRMVVKQVIEVEDYLRLLQQDGKEVQALFKELLIGVTSFFRDDEAFDALQAQVIPQLFNDRRHGQPIRVWTPACATGEEAYSLAILLQEHMAALKREFKVQLFATDIDEQAIEKARHGFYPDSIAADMPPERLQRFFVKHNGSYQVSEQLRRMVVFATQSVIKDPPFSRLDLISCRNLLIYLEPPLQKKVVAVLYHALRPGGYLFLGSSETPVDLAPFLNVIDRKWKVFQRPVTGPDRPAMLEMALPVWAMPNSPATEPTHQPDIRRLIEKLILEQYVLPCMVINEQYEILYIYGRVGKFLEPAVGQVDHWSILRLLREELRIPVGAAVRQAIAQKETTVSEVVPLTFNGDALFVTVSVQPLHPPTFLQGLYVVVFEAGKRPAALGPADSAPPNAAQWRGQRVIDLEQELRHAKEYLQATIEELESSSEEIKSTNEELQSANEELETSQEEAQSVNEELVTLNAELQDKVEQLTWVNSDINNILASIDIGIIFLDRHLYIRRFNQAATSVINLIETDVGRPVGHLVSKLAQDDWVQTALTVFQTLIPQEIEVHTISGQWYSLRVRPYRTTENAIEGVVLTFTLISEKKQVARRIEAGHALVKTLINAIKQPLLVLDANLRVILANGAFHQLFRVNLNETGGQLIYELGNRQWDIPRLRQLLEEIIPQNHAIENFEVDHNFPTIGPKKMRLNAQRVQDLPDQPPFILLTIEDVTTTD